MSSCVCQVFVVTSLQRCSTEFLIEGWILAVGWPSVEKYCRSLEHIQEPDRNSDDNADSILLTEVQWKILRYWLCCAIMLNEWSCSNEEDLIPEIVYACKGDIQYLLYSGTWRWPLSFCTVSIVLLGRCRLGSGEYSIEQFLYWPWGINLNAVTFRISVPINVTKSTMYNECCWCWHQQLSTVWIRERLHFPRIRVHCLSKLRLVYFNKLK